ncbi:hypothetical protein BGZ65_005359, partial [Modicella reniformis]
MAYGQTSSGKTYTMGTASISSEDRGNPTEGIIPRAVAQLFHDARRPPPVYPGYRIPLLKTTFRVSFVELYNEDLIDLLARGEFRPPVTIREDTKGNIYWTGVQEIVVTSVEEVVHLLWFGSQNRQTHSTEMNEKSSRSHAIFSITLRQEKFVPTHPPPPVSPTTAEPSRRGSKLPLNGTTHINGFTTPSGRPATPTTPGTSIPSPYTSGIVAPGSKLRRLSAMPEPPSLITAPSSPDEPEPEGEWVVLNSKFHFVDLAGSERLKRTSAIGDRAKEGISINAGLHALGNVISALGDPGKKASHIPYRDSKLTRLLQDSLGGNALALMIACVSPTELNLGETLNTLKYANRARNIKNSSSLNQELNMDNPEYLRSIIQKLKIEIKMLKDANAAKSAGMGTGETTPIPALDHRSSPPSNRHSIASASMSQGSHHFLNGIQEEDDRYSDISPSARTTIEQCMRANGASLIEPKDRANLPSLTTPFSGDSNFLEFVEPVIEEYEKVITGLESRLAVTQAALNHSELMLEERQTRLEVIEYENKDLLQQKRRASACITDSEILQRQQKELEQQLQTLQNELKEAETRKTRGEQYIQELEVKLTREKEAAEERIQQVLKEREELDRSRATSPVPSNAAKEQELKLLSETIVKLEEELLQLLEEVDAESDALGAIIDARIDARMESDHELEEHESSQAKREELLVEKLESKMALEEELESLKTQYEALLLEITTAKAPHPRTDSAHGDEDHHEDGLIEKLDIAAPAISVPVISVTVESVDVAVQSEDAAVQSEAVAVQLVDVAVQADDVATSDLMKQLESELAAARDTERLLKEDIAVLTEKFEKLQKDYASAMEMEETLCLAVSDLEGQLKTSQDSDSQHQEKLEQSLSRIQDLEERSIKVEQESLKMMEELKSKLAKAQIAADDRVTDDLLELLEKLEQERTKVEALQVQVENHLAELVAEEARAAELEADRDAIRSQWDTEKSRAAELETDRDAIRSQWDAEKSRAAGLEADRDVIRSQWDAEKSKAAELETDRDAIRSQWDAEKSR